MYNCLSGDILFKVIRFRNIKCYICDVHLLPESVPEGMFQYEMRQSADEITIEHKVFANFFGTLLAEKDLSFCEFGCLTFDTYETRAADWPMYCILDSKVAIEDWLEELNMKLSLGVRAVLDKNKQERHIRGGKTTSIKYASLVHKSQL